LKYQTTTVADSADTSPELLTLKLRYKEPDEDLSRLLSQPVLDATTSISAASENLRFAASVAELGMLLRESPHKGNASYDQVTEIASSALGGDPEGHRAEFLQLVNAASRVGPQLARED
jgi:Ca-activated chloride channel homolog